MHKEKFQMHKEQFPVQFSVLSSRALEETILSRYPIEKPYQCRFLTPGLNDIYCQNTGRHILFKNLHI